MRNRRNDSLGGFHHVMNRSARRFDCFLDDGDRRFFLDQVAQACEQADARAFAYVLMGNHFHLGLHCPTGGLSEVMKLVSENYTRAFNQFHGFDGPLFRGRFTSIPIEDDAQLAAVSRYIHRNPLELGYRIDQYPWSSYASFLGRRTAPDWLDVGLVLAVGSGVSGYQTYVETDADSDETAMVAGRRRFPEQPSARPQIADLFRIDQAVAQVAGCDLEVIRQRTDGRANPARAAALLIASDLRVFPPDVLAAHYRYSSKSGMRTALHRTRQQIGRSEPLASLVQNVRNTLGIGGGTGV